MTADLPATDAQMPTASEMARRIAAFDWAATPLGPKDSWPQSLRTTIDICLNSRFPMFVWWGPQLINFYNDAYIPILGRRHPGSLGQPAGDLWAEVWPTIGPQVDAVLTRGQASWHHRVPLTVERNGFSEEAFFTWSHSAIRDESGAIAGVLCVVMEETANVQAERERERLAAQHQIALDSAGMGWWTYDPTKRSAVYDKRFRQIFGVTDDNPTDQEMIARIHPDDQQVMLNAVYAAVDPKSSTPYACQYRVVMPDGKIRWVDAHGKATFEGEGENRRAVTMVGTITDVTDLKSAADEREQLLLAEQAARAEAERVSRLKDEFLATLSHEIRTPLNAILGWSQLLARGSKRSDAEIDEGLQVIERNARAQTQIIEDLLDMSRIISGKLHLNVQAVDLGKIITEAVASIAPSADLKGLSVRTETDVADASHNTISGDPNRIRQILLNLLSNAVKFTPRGGQIDVRLHRLSEHLILSVTDTGEGIPPEFVPHVFDRFRQADATTTRRHGGLGLGLSIVKQLVELHGGVVKCHSAGRNHGAMFTVSFPTTPIGPAALPDASRTASPVAGLAQTAVDRQLNGKTILVVDDEPDARDLAQRLLQDCGAQVVTAGNAAEAMNVLSTNRPDVLVCDIGMPGEDGYSLLRRLRTLPSEQGGQTPALALTAYARQEDKQKAHTAGFQHHLTKPVEPSELIAKVVSLCTAGIHESET